jgi:hypothetical protein
MGSTEKSEFVTATASDGSKNGIGDSLHIRYYCEKFARNIRL